MSGPDDGQPPGADSGDDELTMTLLMAAAKRYGMKTDATDWEAVTRAATRARHASETLHDAAAGRPLRVIPPRRP